MNTYISSATRRSNRNLGFSVQRPADSARSHSADSVATFSYSQGIPSYPKDCLRDTLRLIYAEAGATSLVISGRVDDQVSISVPGCGSYTSPSGAGVDIAGSISLPGEGYYLVSASHTNIDYPPNGNVSFINCTVSPVMDIIGIVPDENEPPLECTCECTCAVTSGNDGGMPQQNDVPSDNPFSLAVRSVSSGNSFPGLWAMSC